MSLVQWHKHGLWRQTSLSGAPLPHPQGRRGGWQGAAERGWAALAAALVQEAETSRGTERGQTRPGLARGQGEGR